MNETMCYIGRKACGCIVTVATDKPEYRADNAKEVAAWIRQGLTVERMSVKDVHKAPLGCKHSEPPKKTRSKKTPGDDQPRLI